MLAGPAEILRLIPHAGSMCLLDGVLHCDAQRIRCISRSHRDQENPLRTAQGLPLLCGVEYAAQAMAVHGGMTSQPGVKPRAGYLVGLRDVSCKGARLDDLPQDLIIDAEKLMGDDTRVMYQFSLRAGEAEVLQGKATVVLDVDRVAA